ncbi:Uncharacterized 21.2 kDa protein in hutC 3'region [Pseudomonas sp. 8Z]|uniref:HutD/Ves family protein n=1 Tax=Pseudomonas sp. 8Z TaxID=2653166 RepID=UPI0012F0BA13|nr:HutD family protein [Pseudomonas sp. 8Z]VXC87454.1 Uncharacterized 21.2 kDa protein in hutC 3'region [Pseudomonas sp. 8Z]
MSGVRLLRANTYTRMPWKNGAGSTLEIARDDGEALDAFGWRLSIADVGESGGFSRFTGYQRVITVLEGAGMRLEVDGQPSRDLTRLDAFAFAGGATVDCTLIGGPIRDFNLIYDPLRYAARLQWLQVDGTLDFFSSAHTLLLFAAQGHPQLLGHDCLNPYDCLQIAGSGELQPIRLVGEGVLCLIELIAI